MLRLGWRTRKLKRRQRRGRSRMHGAQEKQDAWCPGVPTIVIHYESVHCDADGKRISAHWAGKHGAVRDVDKTVLAEK